MITKISANGSSDINMLLASPPAAAWAYAGVISIRTILVSTEKNRLSQAWPCWAQHLGQIAGPGKFARTIAAAGPIATWPDPSFRPLAGASKARYGCAVRN